MPSLTAQNNQNLMAEIYLKSVRMLVTYPAAWFVYNVYFHPLAGYPGPLLYRGSNFGKIVQQMRGNITNKMNELHQIYGPVVRIAPWELSYISAQAWKDIYTGQKGEPIITKHVNLFMQRMRDNAGEAVDLVAWFNFTAFDIIGDLTFGEPFGCLENSQMHPWIRFIFANLKGMMYGQIISTMGIFGAALKMLVPKRLREQVLQHAAYSRDKVDRRLERRTSRPDFMAYIIKHVGKEGGLSANELLANAQILIMAGSETSATLLAGASYFLMRNPDKRRKLEQEVRSAFTRESEISFASVCKLPYTLAVLHEAMRMHPPVPAGIHRFTPDGGAEIDGKWVAGGADVVVHQWAAYRNERYAGDNRDAFQPFGVGPRSCIGRGLAYMESRLVLARLVWNFDMELMPESWNWTAQKTWVLYEKLPLKARLAPRCSASM
ncbi:isotrichodermin C-15 hydroxylase [Lasiosphaeria hispida]|uniref:Isotrichodermin C-15 hydroxylase n=1 Tax=Lasiosphaeria hispida TaxID=260671 RepID=A0AAJ0MCM0_9PEZI|nr:isotrichodermin C-15 hydroxylase [Lasiosphaeria hispida]